MHDLQCLNACVTPGCYNARAYALEDKFSASNYVIRDDIRGVIAVYMCINNIVLKKDAQQVVWALQRDDFRLSMLGGLVHELKELLGENFVSSQV
jgi:hypothetical protein